MKTRSTYNPRTIIWKEETKSKGCDKKQRILVVASASPFIGGIESYIDDLLSSELKDQFLLGQLDPLEIKKRFQEQKSHLSLKELNDGFRVIISFIKAMRKFDPALVHIHTSSYWGFYEKAFLLAIAKIVFKRKVIFHIHGGEFDLFYHKSLLKRFIDRIIHWADKRLIVSKKIKENIGDTCMTVVDNSTHFDDRALTVDKGALRDKYGIPKEKTVFLSVAILEKRKRIYETVEVFKDILACRNDFVFIIAGQGPEKERILRFINKHSLNNNVEIYDYIDGQEKEEIFLLADVFIFNSSNESFGVTLMEAVSHCLFVITTPVGIASDAEKVFNNENCSIVPINNNDELRDSILAVLDKRIDIAKAKKKNYFDFKKRFDKKPVFDKLGAIYRHMLDDGTKITSEKLPAGRCNDRE